VALSAEEALRQLDPHTALKLFESADPADMSARCGRIRALWALRQADDARAALNALPPEVRESAAGLVAEGTIALGLRDSPVQLGITRGSTGRDDRAAIDAFTAAVALNPADPVARRGLVTAYRVAERAAEARATVDAAIAELGPLPGLLVESAWCHFDRCHLKAALQAVEPAREDIEAQFATAAILEQGPWPPDAMPAYDRLRHLVPEASPVLQAQLAKYQAYQIAWTTGETERAECAENARQALLLFPGDPMALNFLSFVQQFLAPASPVADAEGKEVKAEPYDDPDLPESPGILIARYRAALQENRVTDALAHIRRARALDPHLHSAAADEIYCLSMLGRYRELRIVAQSVLERCPDHDGVRHQLAMAEAGQGHTERALELLPDDIDPRYVIGKISVLRQLGDFAAAEALASHPPRRPTGDWELQLRQELAENSIAQRHWKQAVTRLDAVLELDPADSEARKNRRKAARRARFGFGSRPPSDDTDAAISDTQNLTSLLDEMLPPDSPPSLRAQLHQIHRQRRATQEDGGPVPASYFTASYLGALVVLVLSYWALRAVGASDSTLLAIALPFSEFVTVIVLFTWIANDGPSVEIWVITTLAGYGATAAILLEGHGHPSTLLLFPALDAAYVATFMWMIVACAVVAMLVTTAQSRRQHRENALGYLVHDMLDLLVLLEYEPGLIRPEVRRECLATLERIAHGQERLLTAAIRSGGGMIEQPTEHAFRQHVASVVAATRDLKRDVLSPGPGTWAGLRARLHEDLAATCHGHWDLLPHRTPDPAGRALRIRLLSALRSLLVLLTPPGLLYLVSATRLLPVTPSQPVLLLFYFGWPALVIMFWLDPQLLAKVNLVKTAADTVSSLKQDKSIM